ncbi:cell division cycle protein 16 [Echinococcus multilocularis]|uniref:Cell division cycle protein 16 n=1 Tax=Echinococcus multilocularis TaxID=6211 RepID=A0A068YE15_ECHMU|nr:cell division cycle protein 16 [Echinococcus multilocularis]
MHQHRSAIFWADKLINLSKDTIKDTLLLADVLIYSGQYRRTIDLLTRNDKLRVSCSVCSSNYYARFLVAQCYFKCNEFVEALNVLENLENFQQNLLKSTSCSFINFSNPDVQHDVALSGSDSVCLPDGVSHVMLNSSVALLRGHVHEALNNIALAVNCYKEAFRLDPFCFEALEKLLKLEALSDDGLLSSLINFLDEKRISKLEFPEFSQALSSATKNIYSCKVPQGNPAGSFVEMTPLRNSVDVLLTQAEYFLSINHYRKCFEIVSGILANDPLNPECLPIHISVLKMLDKSNDLFMLANNLVRIFPKCAISWFATGSYYLCTHKNDLAKRHLRKATQEDRRFGPAWLALGHAYAADSEHDQAIAAYCTAAQIVRHSHMPMLYIGVEYSSSGNQALAERFMQHALQRSPSDPAVLHELGTLALSLKRYNKALKLLKQAYHSISQLSGQVIAPYWEPLLNNLGHAYRELGHFEEALKMHTAALKLVENSPTTLETMGLIYAQMGRYGEAIRALQTALPLHTCRTDSTTAVDLLDICVRQYARQLEVPLLLAPTKTVNATANDVVITTHNDEFEVGRDINESPPKEPFQLLDYSLSTTPPPGIPSIKDDLDIFQVSAPPPQKCAPSGSADPAEDVSMELD